MYGEYDTCELTLLLRAFLLNRCPRRPGYRTQIMLIDSSSYYHCNIPILDQPLTVSAPVCMLESRWYTNTLGTVISLLAAKKVDSLRLFRKAGA